MQYILCLTNNKEKGNLAAPPCHDKCVGVSGLRILLDVNMGCGFVNIIIHSSRFFDWLEVSGTLQTLLKVCLSSYNYEYRIYSSMLFTETEWSITRCQTGGLINTIYILTQEWYDGVDSVLYVCVYDYL